MQGCPVRVAQNNLNKRGYWRIWLLFESRNKDMILRIWH
jgi:hypothetical protein